MMPINPSQNILNAINNNMMQNTRKANFTSYEIMLTKVLAGAY